VEYKEISPVFSYYVIKTLFLLSWNDFMDWCKINNKNILQFDNKPKVLLEFVKLISKLHRSEKSLETIRHMENWFSTHENYRDKYVIKNLRMTMHEM
jgi:hypothetical protein